MLNEELFDMDLMDDELDREQYVAETIMSAGHGVICPLANSVRIEESNMFTGQEFIDMDMILMRNMVAWRSAIVMRRGWLSSVGANNELQMAESLNWLVLDMEELTDEEFKAQLEQVLATIGPCTMYIAGKYRHYRTDEITGE